MIPEPSGLHSINMLVLSLTVRGPTGLSWAVLAPGPSRDCSLTVAGAGTFQRLAHSRICLKQPGPGAAGALPRSLHRAASEWSDFLEGSSGLQGTWRERERERRCSPLSNPASDVMSLLLRSVCRKRVGQASPYSRDGN